MAEPTAPALELTAMDQRILGSLLEKQRTVPASYPMTFNALRTACNQTSSRDPVVEYTQREVEDGVRDLRHRELVRIIHTPGQRVLKCHQLLDERLGLADDERALITVLLLRGPQAPGELKTRTERLYPFADRTEVEGCLARLADRAGPLVRQLPRQAGQHDRRWVHLLGPAPVAAAHQLAGMEEDADREAVLAEGAAARDDRVRHVYQRLAELDAPRAARGLDHFEAWLLTGVASGAQGPVLEVGCGTGRIAAHLADAGAEVTGLDVAPAMVERARSEHPGLRFEVGDLRTVMRPPAAAAWGVIVAWDCLSHFAPSELPSVFAGLARVLAVGGLLTVALPVGPAPIPAVTTPDGDPDLPVVAHDRHEVLAAIEAAGLECERWYHVGGRPGAGDGSGAGGGSDAGPLDEQLIVLARRSR